MKEIVNEIGKIVTNVADQLGKKAEPIKKITEDAVEVQRLKAKIRTLQKNNVNDLHGLGVIVYSKYKEGAITESEFIAICEEIDNRNMIIEQLEEQIVKVRGEAICDNCKSAVSEDAIYCSKCGVPLHKEDTSEADIRTEDIFEAEDVVVDMDDEVDIILTEGDVVEMYETEDPEIEIELVVEESKE